MSHSVESLTARREHELAEFFRHIFATSVDGMLLTSPDGRTFAANPAACAMLGRTEAELQSIGRAGVLDSREPGAAAMLEERRQRRGVRHEVDMIRSDGTIFPCELSSSTYIDGNGEERAVVILRDATERRNADRAFRHSEEQLRLALDGGDLGLWDWNPTTGALAVNARWRTMLGLPATDSDATIDFWRSLVHPDDLPILEGLTRDLMLNPSGQHFEAEIRARHAAGHYVWILDKGAVVGRDANGRPLRVVGTHMDVTARKTAEAASREAEARLRFALDAAEFGDWSRDLQTDAAVHSLQHDRCFGFTEAIPEWSYRTFLSHVHPHDRERIHTAYQAALAGEREYDVEFRAMWPSGVIHWLWARGRCYFDDKHRPIRIVGIVADISRRLAAEQLQRDDATRLRMATEASNTGLWDWNVRTNEVYFSATWKRQLGFEEHELENSFETWKNRLHPDDVERALATVNAYSRNPGPFYENEFRLRHKDGSYRWILAKASLVADADGNPVRFLGSHVDVTERKAAEAAIHQSERRFRGAIEASPVPIALADLVGNLTYINPQFVRTFGYTPGDVPTIEAWWSLAHPDPDYRCWVRSTWQERQAAATRAGSTFEPIEMSICCKDGLWRAVVAQTADLEGSSGATRLITLFDVTEQRRLEGRIMEAVTHEKCRLGMDLHDGLGQELTGLSLLLRGSARSLRQAEPKTIESELLRLADIAQQCLITARGIAHGLSPINLENGGLERALQRLAEATQLATGVQVRMFNEGSENLAKISQTKAEPIFRIVQEALTNAARHSGATQIDIGIERVRRMLHLTIADNGSGFMVGGASSGFGIRIMHYRARAIGGHLQVESRPNGGAVVRCIFPARSSAQRRPRQHPRSQRLNR
jgi:PAS domain S-box-containing protein